MIRQSGNVTPGRDVSAPGRRGPEDFSRSGAGRKAVLLGLLCFVVYNANLRWIGAYDSVASSILPFGIWRGDGLHLDHYSDYGSSKGYSIVRTRDGRLASLYPIVTPLLVAPLYFPTLFSKVRYLDETTENEYRRLLMEKLSASIVASISVVFLWLTLRAVTSRRKATVLSAAYAFGTVTWTISSQALWQHGAAQLLLSAALYVLYGRKTAPATPAILGALAGLVAANRPVDLMLSAALGLIILRRVGKRSWPFFAVASIVAGLALFYNLTFFGSPTGGYSTFRFPNGVSIGFGGNPLYAIAHLLFSNRGLLFFSPFFLFFLRKRALPAERRGPDPVERSFLLGAVLVTWLLYGVLNTGWSGGYTYGPRYTADAMPVLVFLLASHLDGALRRTEKFLLGATLAIAFAIQLIGAFCYPGGNSGTEDYGYWDFSVSGPALAFRAGPQQPHFLGWIASGITMDRRLEPQEMRATYRWDLDPEEEWPAGTCRTVRFRIWNDGPATWSSLGRWGEEGGVRIVTRWESLDARVPVVMPETRFWLGTRVRPDYRVRRELIVQAPETPGWFRLTVELVQVGFVRFSDAGCPPLQAEIRLTGNPR